MEDVRIGRETLSRSYSVSVLTTKGVLVARNTDRQSLIISAPLTNPLWLSWDATEGAGVGILIAAGTPPLRLNVQEYGRLVEGPIYANITTTGETIAVAETVLQRQ